MSTKTAPALQASTSQAAGAVTTSTTLDLTSANGAVVTAQITNGGTGPTAAGMVTINVTQDGGATWQYYASGTAGVTASTAYSFVFDIAAPVLKAQAVFSGNTVQPVTVAAQAHVLGALA